MKRRILLTGLIITGLLIVSTAMAGVAGDEWTVSMWDSDGELLTDTWCINMANATIGKVDSDSYGEGGVTCRTNFFGKKRILLNFPDDYTIFSGIFITNHGGSEVIYGMFVNYITGYHGTFVAVPGTPA
ncbi:hypothetical protein GF312_07770 [Candidatus Poribacteria bacterium]|nr:hypothetical protein [Candidatus Poribacteria bacterium]